MKKVGLRWATLSLCILALALLGGAGQTAASTTSHCNTPDPSGRLFCVSIEDLDGVSPSGLVGSGKRQVDVEAYQFYKLTITNSGGNTLTNGTVKVVLTDNVTDVGRSSTGPPGATGRGDLRLALAILISSAAVGVV